MRNFYLGIFLLLATLFSFSNRLQATHLMGGEITWECNGNGEYVFTFKVYRDCSGNNISPNSSGMIQIHNYPIAGNVIQIPPSQWTTVANNDISPDCTGPGSFSCANGDDESVFEYVRTFTRRLNGTPPAAGWIITYDDVARNSNDNIQGQPGVTLRAKILPHSGSIADTCVDNSPQFRELATSLICVGIPFNYNHNATDDELDSLAFEWARPLNAIGTNQLYVEGSVPGNVSFQSGYSFNSPFPGIAQDVRNVPATLDSNTGEISLTSFTSGKFVSVVKVSAYKCGEKVAEIYRELQSNLANSPICASNDKPIVRPPFQDGNGNFTQWNDTVRAGDLVNFNIQIQDFASIAQNGGDSVTLLATGLQFGANYTNPTTGCINPPCATLTSSLPQTGFLGVSNSFSWQTDCNHTAFTDRCVSGQNTYTFVISAVDNRCPLPLKNVGTISITVLADSVILSPLIHCADVQANGDVQLDWNTTPNINNSFSAWMIYSATAENGPYSIIDSVKTYGTTSYTHVGANAQNQRRWYYIRSRSGCKGKIQNIARDTVSTIFIDPVTTPTQVDVNWNPLAVPNPQGSASQYELFREYTIGTALNFFQNISGESYTDNFPNCEDSVRYRVDLVNNLEGCTSRSNTLLYQVQFPDPTAGFAFPPTACPGDPITFTNTTSISGGTLTYTWDFGDGSPTSNQTDPTHTYASTGTYSVQLIANTPKGCSDTISQQIQITLPTADAGPDVSICPGNNVQIGGSPTTTASSPTFNWAPSASLNNAGIANPTASPTTTTTYSVTVTDGNGCTNTDQLTVTVSALPVADAGADQSLCVGSSVMIGGAPTGPVGATYQWDNAATLDNASIANPMASPTITTVYTVTVSTGINCSATDQVTVTVDPSPTANAGADQDICIGAGVTIGNVASGGLAPYTYSWSPASGLSATNIASPTANPITTTSYTVTVTDANGCTDDDIVTVTVNSATADAGGTFTICNGAGVSIGGTSSGTAPLTYSWSNGASLSASNIQNPVASPTANTNYTLTVTDANGCTDTDLATVIVNSLPIADAGPDLSDCDGATVSIGGSPTGPAGSSYSWSPTANLSNSSVANPSATVIGTVNYTVTVTDVNGCTNTDQVSITAFPTINPDAGADQSICNGGSVAIGGSSSGGTAPLTFAWNNGASLSSTSIQGPIASPSVTTTYTLTVSDANGCTATDVVTVTVNSLPTVDAGADQNICDGTSATLGGSPTGPAGSTYAWDNAGSLNNASASNPIASPAATTTYTVTVTDGNGCSDTDQITITVDPLPDADAGPDQIICENENVTIGGSPTSTVAGATFAWNNGASLSSSTIANPIANPIVTTTYTVTVTHTNGCTSTDQVLVTVNPAPIADAGPDQDICIGQSTPIGGSPTGPAGSTFAWDNGASLSSNSVANPTATPNTTTTYTVTVTDLNGCSNTDQVTVTVNPLPVVDAGLDQTICSGDNATLGGAPTGPAGSTYNWDNPGSLNNASLANPVASPITTTTYTVTVTDGNGCSNTDQVLITVNPLPNVDAGPDQAICDQQSVVIGGSPTSSTAGASFAWDNGATLSSATVANPTANPTITTTYTLTVTHPNGCTATDAMTVTVNPLPNADAGPDQDICIGQSTTIGGSPTGPAGSSYVWDNSASLNDATLANPTASPTVTTTYAVTVTDGNGCTNTDAVTITVNPLPTVDAGPDQTICDQQTVVIGGSPTSSTPGATFSWDNTASLNSGNLANPTASPSVTTTYTVTVTDVNGCSATDAVTITVNPLPNIDAGPDQTICDQQSVTIGGSPTSTTPGVSYAWDNGASLSSATIANPVATPSTTTTYTLTITDGNGCTATDAVTITVNPLPTADAGADQIICTGDNATLGGSPTGPAGASFVWDNAASLSSATVANPIATPTVTTAYTVTVTDGNGCTDTDQVLITVNPVPTADAGPDFSICDLSSITIGGSPTSTTAGATFAWDNAATLNNATSANPTASPSTTTTYTVTVTHPNGCTATDAMTITVNPLPTADAGLDQDICIGQSATIGGSPTGPTGSTYQWDNGITLSSATVANPIATPFVSTTYSVTVTDANGCTDTDQVLITVNPLPNIDAGLDQDICFGQSATLGGSPTSSTPNVSYAWNNAASLSSNIVANPTATPNNTTTYSLTVTDANGCSNIDAVTITVNPLPNVDAGPDISICAGGSTLIGGSPTSTTAGVSYLWDNTSSLDNATLANPTADPSTTTTYTVTVTDGNGCADTDQMTLTVNPLPIADAGPDQSICENDSATLGGSPTGPGGSTYAWDNAASLSNANVANPNAGPLSTTQYIVTVTDVNGCVSNDTVVITVNPAPIIDAGPDQTICRTDSVMIGGSPSGPAGVSYSWTPTNGLSDPTIANPMASPSDTTRYFLTITDVNSCSSIDSMVVNVNELPLVDFRVDATCFGDFAAFTDQTSLNSSNIQSWNWDFGDNSGSSVLQNPAYQYASPGTYDVKLIVTSDLACIDSAIQSVTINPLPVVDAGADTAICENDTIQLGGNPSGPVNANFNWSPALGLSDAGAANPSAFPLSSTEYYLSVTDAAGCINYDTVNVTVNPLPTITSGADTSICKGDDVQLIATGGSTYSWEPTDFLSDPLIANPIASPELSTAYVVFGADVNGCVDTDTTFIRVFNVEFDPKDTSVCYGDSVQLKPIIDADAASIISYVWSPSIGLDDPNAKNPKASPPITTKYQVLVEDQRGCIDVDSVLLRINPPANVDFEYDISPRCQGAVIELLNTSTATDDFLWKLNGIGKTTDFNPEIEMDYEVENQITLIGSNAQCTDSISRVIPAQSFDEIFEFKDVNAFSPNGDGINDLFDPGFKGEYVGCVNFRIYDRWGDKVFDSNNGQYGWDGRTIYGKRAANGLYYYIIEVAGQEIRGSVYLQR